MRTFPIEYKGLNLIKLQIMPLFLGQALLEIVRQNHLSKTIAVIELDKLQIFCLQMMKALLI